MNDQPKPEERAEELGRLWWLVDAPLFSDSRLIAKFHDAIVWPEVSDSEKETVKKKKIETNMQADTSAGGKAEVGLPDFLSWLGPKLDAEAKLSAGISRNSKKETTETVIGTVVENSERKLIEITAEYLAGEFSEKVLFVDAPGGRFTNLGGRELEQSEVDRLLENAPRPLVFIDTKSLSPILPTMIELDDGGFSAAYERFEDELFGRNEIEFPSDDADLKSIKSYWEKLNEKFSSRFAMEVIEECCDGNRIGWIDFRMLFSEEGSTLHLHVSPAGQYHTGTFAYNFVHRGYKYGCRIIGTLKSGNGVNVLAIYDK